MTHVEILTRLAITGHLILFVAQADVKSSRAFTRNEGGININAMHKLVTMSSSHRPYSKFKSPSFSSEVIQWRHASAHNLIHLDGTPRSKVAPVTLLWYQHVQAIKAYA